MNTVSTQSTPNTMKEWRKDFDEKFTKVSWTVCEWRNEDTKELKEQIKDFIRTLLASQQAEMYAKIVQLDFNVMPDILRKQVLSILKGDKPLKDGQRVGKYIASVVEEE